MLFENFMNGYDELLHFVAKFTAHTLEMVGIGVIIVGAVKAIIRAIRHLKRPDSKNVIVALGRALALALEFKMGAEIVNTVIIRDMQELAVLAIVIALRAILALLIHWEIRNEKQEEMEKQREEAAATATENSAEK